MTSSMTLTLNGNTSELSANYFPPIKLDEDGEYVCGLVDFQTSMSIPNITEENNRFYFLSESTLKAEPGFYTIEYFLDLAKENIQPEFRDDPELEFYLRKSLDAATDLVLKDSDETNFRVEEECTLTFFYVTFIEIPVGSYELTDIDKHLTFVLNKTRNETFVYITLNKNTLKCSILSNLQIFFNKSKTFRDLLGFKSHRVLEAHILHDSDSVVNTSTLNAIKIDCNITSGAYSNDRLGHTIHEFYPSVEVGYKIVEVPQSVIYLPVTVRTINNLTIRCVDQDNKLVDFRGETITLRVHIKKI